MENFGIEKPAEETTRKLSKTVLHAAERLRQSLFEKLTAANAERIAELLKEKPVFYENKAEAPRTILLDDEIAEYLPPEFFDDPTKWIESQENIKREHVLETLPTGETIEELWDKPYDISKVKEFSLIGKKDKKISLASKRIDQDQLEEIALARKAWEAGIPTARILGEIADKGNTYVFFERIRGINFLAAQEKLRLLSVSVATLHIINEKDFYSQMHYEYNNILSEKAKKIIYSLWEKARPDIIKNRDIYTLRENLNHAFALMERVEKDEDYKDSVKDFVQYIKEYAENKYNLPGINTILNKFNYPNPIQFIDHCLDLIKLDKKEEFREIVDFINSEYKNIRDKIKNEFDSVFISKIYKDVFGFNPYEEIKKVKKLCEEKRIEHKDFNDRNILIEWDFDKNKPKRKKESEKNKIYIIDWEPKPKSLK